MDFCALRFCLHSPFFILSNHLACLYSPSCFHPAAVLLGSSRNIATNFQRHPTASIAALSPSVSYSHSDGSTPLSLRGRHSHWSTYPKLTSARISYRTESTTHSIYALGWLSGRNVTPRSIHIHFEVSKQRTGKS